MNEAEQRKQQQQRLTACGFGFFSLFAVMGLLFFAALGSTQLNEVNGNNQLLSADGVAYCYYDPDKDFIVVSSAVLTWLITGLLGLSSYVSKAWKSLKPFWWLTLFAGSLSLLAAYRCFELLRYWHQLEAFCSY